MPVPFYIMVPAYSEADRPAMLEAAAAILPRAAAAVPELLDAAMPDILRGQHEDPWYAPGRPKLTAAEARELLGTPTINVHPGPDVRYLYDGGEPFGWDTILVEVDADFRFREVMSVG